MFADVLRSFTPFDIEELSTHHLVFGGAEPLLVIIENSPLLKRVYLRNNISEELLAALEKHCPLLHTFHMEKCMGEIMVPVNCLYKTFFRGLDYNAVVALITNTPLLEKQKYLSFPHLQSLNLGKLNDINTDNKKDSLSLFVYILLYFYSHPINVTSDPPLSFSPALPEELPLWLHDICYKVQNCSLNGIQRYFTSRRLRSNCEVTLPIDSVYQLTITHTSHEEDVIQEVMELSKIWIPKLECKTLFIYTLHDADQRFDIAPLYTPLFSQVGTLLNSLHFSIVGDVDMSALSNIISLCPSLENLRLRLTRVHSQSQSKLGCKKLLKLTSLTIYCGEDSIPEVHEFIECLISQSPKLCSLSLLLHGKPCEWLVSLVMNAKLNSICILRLSFECFNFTCRDMARSLIEDPVGVPFYVYLVDSLSNLKVLQLGSLPLTTFRKLCLLYSRSDLQISIWHVPTDSQEWYGSSERFE